MSLMSDIGAAIKNKLMVNDFASQSSNLLTGGGTVSVSAAWEVKWSTRFITINNGKGTGLATNGYFDINMPAAATVITGVGGATNKTVTANGIQMNGWESLYYILPVGGTASTVNANFRVVNFTVDVTIPSTWIKICSRNDEGSYIDFACGVSLRNNTSINTNLYDVKGADVDGAVSSANTLSTARTIQTNLASTSNASFNGSANITPGVTGTLAVGNGGTGVTTSTGTGSNVLSISPALTGTPTAPTAASGISTTQLATTQFVNTTNIGNGTTSFNGFGGAGFKNLIHNPMLEFHQRSNTTLSSGPHTEYICDRWWLGLSTWSGVNVTTSLEQDNRQFPNTTLKVRALAIINPGLSTYFDFVQTYDEYWRFTGRTMTISFSYGSNVTTVNSGNIIIGVRVNGTWQYHTSTTFTPTSGGDHSWTFTFPPYEAGMDACQIIIRQNRTTSGTIWLSRVQLEEGTTQTPFEYRGVGVEMAICSTYYQTLYAAYVPTAYHGGTINTVLLQLHTPMRAAPVSHTYFAPLYGGRFGYRDFSDTNNQVINPSNVTVNNYNSTSVTLTISNGPISFLHNLYVGFYADIV